MPELRRRRTHRPRWEVVLGVALIACGLVLGAQERDVGWVVAIVGGVLATVGLVRVD